MKYNTIINGLPVTATYSKEFLLHTVTPLLHHCTDIYRQTGNRVIVFLAAPPAAGKSTMAEIFMRLSVSTPGVEPFAAIGMDGFHHYQDYLLTHETERDGQMVNMVDIKGAPITFDLEALAERIRRLKLEKEVPWPIYDRTTHNPQDNAIVVKENIVLIEGNYLLLDEPGWRELSEMADVTISITANPEILRERLVQRKLQTCPDRNKALHFVDFSDMANVTTCLEKSMPADICFELKDNGDYICANNEIEGIGAKNDFSTQ